MLSEARKSSWKFWLSYGCLAAYFVPAFIPGIHFPRALSVSLLLLCLAAGLADWSHVTVPQLYFSLSTGILAASIGIVCLWNSWVVILMVPAFLLMAFVLCFLLRNYIRLRSELSGPEARNIPA